MSVFVIMEIIAFVMWCIKSFLFISPFNRVLQIISLLMCFVPFIGPFWMLFVIVEFFCNYEHSSYYYQFINGKQVVDIMNRWDEVVVRYNPITKYLFNEIDWDEVEERKKESLEDR